MTWFPLRASCDERLNVLICFCGLVAYIIDRKVSNVHDLLALTWMLQWRMFYSATHSQNYNCKLQVWKQLIHEAVFIFQRHAAFIHHSKSLMQTHQHTYIIKGCRAFKRIVLLLTEQKATIHQVTTMLATSKNVLFPGHNHLLTTSTKDPSF